jgi:hypothetical protein
VYRYLHNVESWPTLEANFRCEAVEYFEHKEMETSKGACTMKDGWNPGPRRNQLPVVQNNASSNSHESACEPRPCLSSRASTEDRIRRPTIDTISQLPNTALSGPNPAMPHFHPDSQDFSWRRLLSDRGSMCSGYNRHIVVASAHSSWSP